MSELLGSMELPSVITTSVIRSSHQGESHGGVYIVNLQTDDVRQVVDWDDGSIDWSGRGGERGLRGITYCQRGMYVVSNDTIYLYNEDIEITEKYKNRYLENTHEIYYKSGIIYITSTNFDTILRFDIRKEEFLESFCLRSLSPSHSRPTLSQKVIDRIKGILGTNTSTDPKLTSFDPNCNNGPSPCDTFHINSVTSRGEEIFLSGTRMKGLYRTDGKNLQKFAELPRGTHNAQPFGDRIIYNNTSDDEVCLSKRDGTVISRALINRYSKEEIKYNNLPDDYARQAFGRGLCTYRGEYVIVGSSPATINVYSIPEMSLVKMVNISMDKRNAIHGLEIFNN